MLSKTLPENLQSTPPVESPAVTFAFDLQADPDATGEER